MPVSRDEAERMGAGFILVSGSIELVPGLVFSGEVPGKWGPRHARLVYLVYLCRGW